MIDFKLARERAGLTQQQLAELLQMSQSVISRLELNPATAPLDVVLRWVAACGTDIATALREANEKSRDEWRGVDPKQPYKVLDRNLDLLEHYVDSVAPNAMKDLGENAPSPDSLRKLVPGWKKRPTVLLAGKFDSGKTRLANFLIGTDALPSLYTKTTKIPMYIRHLSRRPKWQTELVWILDSDFDPLRWDDETHCVRHRLIAGGFGTLKEYGTHMRNEGAHPPLERSTGAALVYLDAELLHACDLIDLPGVGENSEDERRADLAIGLCDVLIYTSPSAGHLDQLDFNYLPRLLRRLPTFDDAREPAFPQLANFFLIATHTHPAIGSAQLNDIRSSAAQRLFTYLQDSVWQFRSTQGQSVTEELLDSRMYTFWQETPERYERFLKDFTQTISTTLPAYLSSGVSTQVARVKQEGSDFYARQLNGYRTTLNDLAAARKEFHEAAKRRSAWGNTISAANAEVIRGIADKKAVSLKYVDAEIRPRLKEPDRIVAFIEQRFAKVAEPKKEAESLAFTLLVQSLEAHLLEQLRLMSDDVIAKVNRYLASFPNDQDSVSSSLKLPSAFRIPFDSRGAFAAGLATAVSSTGALALWASNLGSMSGYLVTAKLVGLLSSVGLSAASAATLAAALGGPFGLAIGIAALALTAFAATREPWQMRLAKRISASEDPNYLQIYRDLVTRYWDSTLEAFNEASKKVEDEFENHRQRYEDLLNEQDQEVGDRVTQLVARLEQQKSFFDSIPWRDQQIPAPSVKLPQEIASETRQA